VHGDAVIDRQLAKRRVFQVDRREQEAFDGWSVKAIVSQGFVMINKSVLKRSTARLRDSQRTFKQTERTSQERLRERLSGSFVVRTFYRQENSPIDGLNSL
jgi:hypothetical protein